MANGLSDFPDLNDLSRAAELAETSVRVFSPDSNFPIPSGDRLRILQERATRFKEAVEKAKAGQSITQLGLPPEDLAWMMTQGKGTPHSEQWWRRFNNAFRANRDALDVARVIDASG